MLINKLLPGVCGALRSCIPAPYSLPSLTERFLQPGIVWGMVPIRDIVRYHFPRPSERRRVQRHGWRTRMATPEGRRILMRRILKGRHVLSH